MCVTHCVTGRLSGYNATESTCLLTVVLSTEQDRVPDDSNIELPYIYCIFYS